MAAGCSEEELWGKGGQLIAESPRVGDPKVADRLGEKQDFSNFFEIKVEEIPPLRLVDNELNFNNYCERKRRRQ